MGIQPHLQEKILAKTRVLCFLTILTILTLFEKVTNFVKNMKNMIMTFSTFLKMSKTPNHQIWQIVKFWKRPHHWMWGFSKTLKTLIGVDPWPWNDPPQGGPPIGGYPPLQGGTIKWPPPSRGGPKKWTPLPRGGGIYIYNIYIGFGGSQNDHFTTTPNRRVGVYLLFL